MPVLFNPSAYGERDWRTVEYFFEEYTSLNYIYNKFTLAEYIEKMYSGQWSSSYFRLSFPKLNEGARNAFSPKTSIALQNQHNISFT